MPMRAARPCSVPGCRGLAVASGRCAVHQSARQRQPDTRPSAARRGYDRQWRTVRASVLRLHPACVGCGAPARDVHHIVALAAGGTHDLTNLVPLCRSCHATITRRQTPALAIAARSGTGHRIVHLIGQPGSGKSTIAVMLAERTGYPSWSIDAERLALLQPGQHWPTDDRQSWYRLAERIASSSRCIVETAGTSQHDGALFSQHRRLVVLCQASDHVRYTRLSKRPVEGYRLAQGQPDYVRRLMLVPAPTMRHDLVIDTTRPTNETETAINRAVEWLRG